MSTAPALIPSVSPLPAVIYEGRCVVPRQLAGSVFAGIDKQAAADILPAGTEFKQATSAGYKLLHIKGGQLTARTLVLFAYIYSKARDTNSRRVQIDVDEFARQTGRCAGARVAGETRADIYAELLALAGTEICAIERTGPKAGRALASGGLIAEVATDLAGAAAVATRQYHDITLAEDWLDFFNADEVGPVFLRFAVLAQLTKNPLAQWLYMQAAQVASRTFSIDEVLELADLNDGSGTNTPGAAAATRSRARAKIKAAVAELRKTLNEVYSLLVPGGEHVFAKYVHCEIKDKTFRLPELHRLDYSAKLYRAKVGRAKVRGG